jgi:hypothetical protein
VRADQRTWREPRISLAMRAFDAAHEQIGHAVKS